MNSSTNQLRTVIFNSYHNKVALTISVFKMVFVAVNPGSVILQMEWTPCKSLFWKTNDSIAKLTISIQAAFFVQQTFLLKYIKFNKDNKCWNVTTI